MTLSRSFDDLENHLERDPSLWVRIQRADGSSVEGQLLDVGAKDLFLSSAAGRPFQVSDQELQAIDVRLPRRGREWMLAICAIPAATAVLIAFTRLPWVRPDAGYILVGFLILVAIVKGLASIPVVSSRLESGLTRWQRLYSTVAPTDAH
jgi:hypothetical protein